ncbi:AraC family transcriptional regulator of adaptative response / methylphosphotriester-DNA alkyltransferase methyltransferase [Paenibacillus aceris]|uniref:AraC family transcriptional regulator of adaptative response / methylphosphotriester-DNA alkyltransferase methyltransferase n=2 Tax=Paenibacillus aceris TaxID=869555 RepID=A0ABS4I4W8_9BACL|nr:AraC family transcriptional regulator of adaptative response / methylphosphotriester-DNA alkyltransferase methyltransferase [Paenibacillus aceris]
MQDRYWQAIVANDTAYDGKFYYAVKTTGIFCRPSCKSRLPKRENVRVFHDRQEAVAEHYRPCKRCRPDGIRLPDEEWIELIADHMKEDYAEPLTLSVLAEHFYASVYHLQRTFKRVKGVTPLTYLQQLRIEAAQRLLIETDKPVNVIGAQVGIANAAHFATLFQKKTGFTPSEYRQTSTI